MALSLLLLAIFYLYMHMLVLCGQQLHVTHGLQLCWLHAIQLSGHIPIHMVGLGWLKSSILLAAMILLYTGDFC